jgi:hypothetical protein
MTKNKELYLIKKTNLYVSDVIFLFRTGTAIPVDGGWSAQ